MTVEWKGWICLAWLLLIPLSGNAAPPSVAAGSGHTVALKNNGTLVAVGDDGFGQLGLGRNFQSGTPNEVRGLGQIRTLAGGPNHTLALKQDGTVWAWGNNWAGQLGDGTNVQQSTAIVMVNETFNGFLDLVPQVPNNIPSDKMPPFFLATYKSGGLSALTLSADIRGITPMALP